MPAADGRSRNPPDVTQMNSSSVPQTLAQADTSALLTNIIILVVTIGVIFCLFIGSLALYRFCSRRTGSALEQAFDGIEWHQSPLEGDVVMVYHTYHGFLVWFTQTEHCVSLRPSEAKRLLSRLLRFNITWGLLSYGGLLIAPLALANYWAQRRSIKKQVESLGLIDNS